MNHTVVFYPFPTDAGPLAFSIDVPCHSQHVERLVKMVSTAAVQGSSYDAIHQWCLNAQESYEKTPTAAPKKHFVERAQNM